MHTPNQITGVPIVETTRAWAATSAGSNRHPIVPVNTQTSGQPESDRRATEQSTAGPTFPAGVKAREFPLPTTGPPEESNDDDDSAGHFGVLIE